MKAKISKKEKNTRIIKVSSLNLRGVCFGIVLGSQGCSIVLNIDVLRAGLKQRAGSSSQVKLNGAKVHFREVFYSLHSKILKACCIIGVQKFSIFIGRLELNHCINLCIGEKSTQLFVFPLKVIKTSILLHCISFQLFNQVQQLFPLLLGCSSHLSPFFGFLV